MMSLRFGLILACGLLATTPADAAKRSFKTGVSQNASNPDGDGGIYIYGTLNLKAGIETRNGKQVLEIENNWYAVKGSGRPGNRPYSAAGGSIDTFPPNTYGSIPYSVPFKLATPGAIADIKGLADIVVYRSGNNYSAQVRSVRLKSGLDEVLRQVLAQHNITPLVAPVEDPAVVELGRMLFNDKLLGGNRDTSCATCHLHGLATGDDVSLPAGTLGTGLGPERVLPDDRHVVGRNTQPLFNLKFPEITTQFWDLRVRLVDGQLPVFGTFPEFTHILDAQAILPIIVDDEMLGEPGDLDVFGNPNEMVLAGAGPPPPFGNGGPPAIWAALMVRLLGPDGSVNSPTYPELFEAAFPGATHDIRHVGLAIAAYESDAFTLLDSRWDRYVAGDDDVLSPAVKKGALLFYGKAGCVKCHSGNLMTDQEVYNILVPQVGPGKFLDKPDDFGFGGTPGPAGTGFGTGLAEDRYKFRTPPLRNVRFTGPWMHDGAFTTLEAAVRHHLMPQLSYLNYDASQLSPEHQDEVVSSQLDYTARLATFASDNLPAINLNSNEFYELMAFLYALSSPSLANLPDEVPAEVPSGLPVDSVPVTLP